MNENSKNSNKNCEHDLVRFAINAAQVIKEVMDQVRTKKNNCSKASANSQLYAGKRSYSKSSVTRTKKFKTSKIGSKRLLSTSTFQPQSNIWVSMFLF